MPAGWVALASAGGALLSSNSASQAASAQSEGTGKALDQTQRQFDVSQENLAPYRDAGTAALSRLRSLLGISTTQGPIGADFGGSLVDISGGTPKPISDLYASDPAYRKAWDDTLAAHNAWAIAPTSQGGAGGAPGYSSASDSSWIDQQLRARLPATGSQPNQGASASGVTDSPLLRKMTQADIAADPVYNSGLQFGLDEGTKAIDRRAAATGNYDSGASEKALVRFANDYGSTKAGDAYTRFTSDQDRTFGKLSGIAGMGSGATTVGVNAGATNSGAVSNLITGGANAAGAASIAQGNALAGGLNNFAQYQLLSQLSGGGQRTAAPSSNPNLTGSSDLGGNLT